MVSKFIYGNLPRGSLHRINYALQSKRLNITTIACSVRGTTRNLTQPTELAADWAGIDYTNPLLLRPGGIPSGRFCLAKPESRLGCPHKERKHVDRNPGNDCQTRPGSPRPCKNQAGMGVSRTGRKPHSGRSKCRSVACRLGDGVGISTGGKRTSSRAGASRPVTGRSFIGVTDAKR